jgi:hypothetical protein
MITAFLIAGLVLSIGLNVAFFILVKKLLLKIAIYEEWVLDFKTDVIDALEEMREIDKQGVFATSLNDKGVFESDDQVGGIFKELLAVVEKLNQRIQ